MFGVDVNATAGHFVTFFEIIGNSREVVNDWRAKKTLGLRDHHIPSFENLRIFFNENLRVSVIVLL